MTREEWLMAPAEAMRPTFAAVMVLLTVAGYALWFVLLMASP